MRVYNKPGPKKQFTSFFRVMMPADFKKRVDQVAAYQLKPVGVVVRDLLRHWLELNEPPHMRPEPEKMPYAPRPRKSAPANGNGNGNETVTTVVSNGNETAASIV